MEKKKPPTLAISTYDRYGMFGGQIKTTRSSFVEDMKNYALALWRLGDSFSIGSTEIPGRAVKELRNLDGKTASVATKRASRWSAEEEGESRSITRVIFVEANTNLAPRSPGRSRKGTQFGGKSFKSHVAKSGGRVCH